MTENTTKFPEYDSCIEDDFESDLQEEIGADNLRAIKSRIALKPCPFCGGQPELLPCPNPEHHGYFVRCLCDSGLVIPETVLLPTIEAAATAWNRRAVDSSFFSKLLKKPLSLMFISGFSMLAIGVGVDEGTAFFFSILGFGFVLLSTALAIDSLPGSSAQSSKAKPESSNS